MPGRDGAPGGMDAPPLGESAKWIERLVLRPVERFPVKQPARDFASRVSRSGVLCVGGGLCLAPVGFASIVLETLAQPAARVELGGCSPQQLLSGRADRPPLGRNERVRLRIDARLRATMLDS
jgi:hypothetical protein